MTATEFTDCPSVLKTKVFQELDFCPHLNARLTTKVKILGRLLLCSKTTVIFSGAGLSTASGVRQVGARVLEPFQNYDQLITIYTQAAEGGEERVEGFGKKTEAEPTLAHFALSALVSNMIRNTKNFHT